MEDRVAPLLLDWYDRHARALPWRVPPGAPPPDAYRVWLAEVMLQQTTVAAVRPRYERFLEQWPDLAALAAASEEEVLREWAGLGYYSRARSLHRCARQVAALGGFPRRESALRALPGIGDYTAAAIAAIAFGERAVVIDANVERVVARLFLIAEPLPPARRAVRAAAEAITPAERAGDFAQAMMDLGATLCTAREARCAACPLAVLCRARGEGNPLALPVKQARSPRPVRSGAAFWIERDGAVWLVRRPDRGLLAAMPALPDDGWSATDDGSNIPPLAGAWRGVGTVRHVFTHARLDLAVMRLDRVAEPPGEGWWWPLDRLGEAGLPTLYAKAARLAMAAG